MSDATTSSSSTSPTGSRSSRSTGPRQRNALNRDVRKALPAAIERCDADDDVDVMILTGADPAFCAGVDLKEFGSGQVQQGEGFAEVGERATTAARRSAARCRRTPSR